MYECLLSQLITSLKPNCEVKTATPFKSLSSQRGNLPIHNLINSVMVKSLICQAGQAARRGFLKKGNTNSEKPGYPPNSGSKRRQGKGASVRRLDVNVHEGQISASSSDQSQHALPSQYLTTSSAEQLINGTNSIALRPDPYSRDDLKAITTQFEDLRIESGPQLNYEQQSKSSESQLLAQNQQLRFELYASKAKNVKLEAKITETLSKVQSSRTFKRVYLDYMPENMTKELQPFSPEGRLLIIKEITKLVDRRFSSLARWIKSQVSQSKWNEISPKFGRSFSELVEDLSEWTGEPPLDRSSL